MDSIISYAQQSASYQKKIIFNAGIESSIDYSDPKTQYVPKIGLLFSPFGLPFVPIEVLGSNVGSIITQLSWSKDRNNPGGSLAFEITPNIATIQDIFNIISKVPGGSVYTEIWKDMGYDFEDLFKPMSLCQLWIDGYHVSTCTVRSCRRKSSVENESYTNSYSIVLDELGQIYTKSTLSLDTIFAEDGLDMNIIDSMSSAMEGIALIKGVTVQAALIAMINGFIGSTLYRQGMSMSDGFPLAMRLIAQPNPIGGIAKIAWATSMWSDLNLFELSQQSFWDFMKNMIPTPWMEFYTESGGRTIVTETLATPAIMFPGFNYIVARSIPYSNPLIGIVNPSHLTSLLPFDLNVLSMLAGGDFVIITDDDIMEKEIGFDCSNQATLFRTKYGTGGTESALCLEKPIISYGPMNPLASGGIGTFGLNEMTETINCTQLYEAGTQLDSAAHSIIAKLGLPGFAFSTPALSNLLCTWFRNQSRFREGSVTIKCKAWARPGMYCLYLPSMSGKKPENARDIGIYYIDSLTHNYGLTNTNVSCTSTLHLIRGVPLPTSLAKSALLLFDYEVLPPMSGLWDGEGTTLQKLRKAVSVI